MRPEVLLQFWRALQEALQGELSAGGSLQEFLKSRDSRWRLVGRVHFNLAENRRDPDFPFAFMATYVASLAEHGALRHSPLGQALHDYAGEKKKLLDLLEPVSRAADRLDWLKEIVDAGEIFHPLRWTPKDAVRFLKDIEAMEQAGLIVRMPASWRMKSSEPSKRGGDEVGSATPSMAGVAALLDFDLRVSLDGEALTAEETEELLRTTEGLALLRGKWVEIDSERLKATLDQFKAVERLARKEGLPFAQAMRLLAGADLGDASRPATDVKWARVEAGPWLTKTLEGCRDPQALAEADPGAALKAELRQYQETGVRWLDFLTRLRLGACLADDMGLGKTIQVLALLSDIAAAGAGRQSKPPRRAGVAACQLGVGSGAFRPKLAGHAGASRFRSRCRAEANSAPERFAASDLVVTSYGSLPRLDWLAKTHWRLAVLDEAQAIKNPDAKQTRAIKPLHSEGRIALTGTPVENNLRDLWSLFDFLNPGLWVRRRPSRISSSGSPSRSLSPMRRYANSSRPTSCAGSKLTKASSPTCRTRQRSRPSARSPRNRRRSIRRRWSSSRSASEETADDIAGVGWCCRR